MGGGGELFYFDWGIKHTDLHKKCNSTEFLYRICADNFFTLQVILGKENKKTRNLQSVVLSYVHHLICFTFLRIYINICYVSARRSVLGETVPEVLSCLFKIEAKCNH